MKHSILRRGAASRYVAGLAATALLGASGLLAAPAWASSGTHAASTTRSASSVVHMQDTSSNDGWIGLLGGSSQYDGASCVSTSDCFVAGTLDNSQQLSGVIWKTADGGSSWTKSLSAPNSVFDDMSCANADECVAVGGSTATKVPGSSDNAGVAWAYSPAGGWVAATVPAGVREFSWVACAPVAAGACFASAIDGSALRSTDGGLTWSLLTVPTSSGGQPTYLNAPAFIDSNHGYFVGTTTDCDTAGRPACRGVILRTADGGSTWSWENTPSSMAPLENIACPSSAECLAVGTDGHHAQAYVTTDGGATWSPTALPFGLANANGVACGDTNHCYIVGENYALGRSVGTVVFATANAGRTWTVQPVSGSSDGLVDISCASAAMCVSAGFSTIGGTIEVTHNGGVAPQGYWFTASDGGVFGFHAPFKGSTGGVQLAKPVVAMAASRATGGYWLAASDGGVFNFDAPFFGSAGGAPLTRPVVGMAATADGLGYYLVASDGGVFNYGQSKFQGSTGGVHLAQPIIGMAIDTLTGGYWLAAADGGIFSFNAPFQGSTGGIHLQKPIVAIVADPATGGYWLIASDGGVFSFNAPFYGSTGGVKLDKPIVAAQSTPDGHGYWLIASDGGVFSFGDAHFYGSTGGVTLNAPIVGAASRS